MHSYTFPHTEGRVFFFGDLEGGFGGTGVAMYENPGFAVSKHGVSQSQVKNQEN